MLQTQWAVEGPVDLVLELDGHKFASQDTGGPMLCNLVCTAQSRHAHIDFCRAADGLACQEAEVSHITTSLEPEPNREKDFISHRLFWERSGGSSAATGLMYIA